MYTIKRPGTRGDAPALEVTVGLVRYKVGGRFTGRGDVQIRSGRGEGANSGSYPLSRWSNLAIVEAGEVIVYDAHARNLSKVIVRDAETNELDLGFSTEVTTPLKPGHRKLFLRTIERIL